MQKTSVWGVVCWEDFHEEESEGLLPVLHLGSDWPGSNVTLLISARCGCSKGV